MDTMTSQEQNPNVLLSLLLQDLRYNPHAILGIHPISEEKSVIRVFRPGAGFLFLKLHGAPVAMKRIHDAGLFELEVSSNTSFSDYQIYHTSGLIAHDPYAFLPTFGEIDQYLFSKSVHYDLHHKMGGRLCTHQGVQGVKFTVWAPSAQAVSLIGDFNHWDGRVNPMRSLGSSGVWELFVPGLQGGEKYKFEIRTQSDDLKIKADPYALFSEVRPKTASQIADISTFKWTDASWMEKRKQTSLDVPINIYEVHLGSWKKEHGEFLNYQKLAHELAAYCLEMGYTHVELLPIAEHPLDESWGYQVSGFLAVTSRFGTPQDFQYFVNYMHEHNIGVIIDWVPGHFPTDDFSLSCFDGTSLYEHADPRQGFHPHWSTHIFNFGRHEVRSFLLASALVWLDIYHVDGLRVDAVASMLYLDYGRSEGEWIPNCFGGKENLDAIEFLKHANSIIHQRFPGVLTIAEESTSFGGITHPLLTNGMGFDCKWNMGWMNDTLRYFSKDPMYRVHHHNDLTFGLLYAFSERFISVLSHDEVVHGKKSLLSKMPGTYWQKFANLRLLLTYMMCQPGKKLLFMGGEIGQWNEWWCKGEIEWSLLQFPQHNQLQLYVKELNHFYKKEPRLWENDFHHEGFEWVDFHDSTNSVISFKRKKKHPDGSDLFCVLNFTPSYLENYVINLRGVSKVEELISSDDIRFGGSGKTHQPIEILRDQANFPYAICTNIAPLAGTIYTIYYA
jgi:1,4-alpha-glucan branching enzyme